MRRTTRFAMRSSRVAGTISLASLALSGCEQSATVASVSDITIASTDVVIFETGDMIARIADIQPSAGDTVWVLDSAAPFIHAIAIDGSLLGSWGGSGDGPGEFRSPKALTRGPSADVWVLDQGLGRLTRAATLMGQPEILSLPVDSLPANHLVSTEGVGTVVGRVWVHGTSEGFAVARSRLSSAGMIGQQLWQVDLIQVGMDGVLTTLLPLADIVGDPATKYGRPGQYLPYPLWSLCPSGAFALYSPLTNTLELRAPGGASVLSYKLPQERELEVTQARFLEMSTPAMIELGMDTAQMRQELQVKWPEFSQSVSAVFPEYADLHCVTSDVIWLQLFDVGGNLGRGPSWLRITQGMDPQKVQFPEPFRPLRFTDDRVWGAYRGEFDVESIAWIPIR